MGSLYTQVGFFSTCIVMREKQESFRTQCDFNKKFQVRMLELENPKYGPIYKLANGAVVVMIFAVYAIEYTQTKEFNFGSKLIALAFGNFHLAIFGWLCLYVLACSSVIFFNILVQILKNVPSKSLFFWVQALSLFCLCYYGYWFRLIHYFVGKFELYPASILTLALDGIRLLMKQHAYFRTMLEKLIESDAEADLVIPNFKSFIYFSFAPTLIYKETYPRTDRIRWRIIIRSLMEFVLVVFTVSCVIDKLIIPRYVNFGLEEYDIRQILVMVVEACFAGVTFKICTCYAVLHSSQNFCGELLKFGDRKTYLDWWRAESFGEYLKKWNIVVQEWLFYYIFQDCHKITKNKHVSSLLVLLLSSLVHDWIVYITLDMYLPIFFILFFCINSLLLIGGILNSKIGTSLVWLSITIGEAAMVSSCFMEYHSRRNCPWMNSSNLGVFSYRMFSFECVR